MSDKTVRQTIAWHEFAGAVADEMFKVERERVHLDRLRREALVKCPECGWWPDRHARSCSAAQLNAEP